MGDWRAVAESLPPPDTDVLTWVEYLDEIRWTGGHVKLVRFVAERWIADDVECVSTRIADPTFSWSGGDNDREWPTSTGFRGVGGYGVPDGQDRVTHWMPLPEGPPDA